jgi:hypothetical protein
LPGRFHDGGRAVQVARQEFIRKRDVAGVAHGRPPHLLPGRAPLRAGGRCQSGAPPAYGQGMPRRPCGRPRRRHRTLGQNSRGACLPAPRRQASRCRKRRSA